VDRRRFLRLTASGAVASAFTALAAPATETRYIAAQARKFEFTPSEITVTRGQPVTLAVTSADFAHGFTMPDFGVRTDLIPGRTIEVRITPMTEGRYHYLCDNFCGDGHDRMSGILIVMPG
jgi:cytochrome c oxidase subunit 2